MSQKVEGTDSSTEERRMSPVKSEAEECNDESELRPAAELWTEEQAFASVHDLVHYAILSQSGRSSATLRQIYTTCEQKGRIAYKHGKGSRLITANEHWKSQIRHALYTSPRFSRIQGGDDWSVSSGHGDMPKTTLVRVSTASTSTPSSAVKDVKEVEQRPRRKASLGVAVVVRREEGGGGARSPKRGGGVGGGVGGGGSANRTGKRSRLGQTSPEGSEAVEAGGTGTPMPAGSTQTRWPLSEVAGLAAAAMLEAGLDGSAFRTIKPEQLENIKKSGGGGGGAGEADESPPDSSNPSRCGSPAPSASIVVAAGCRSIVPKARDPSRNRRKPAQGLQAAMPSGSASPAGNVNNSMFLERRNSQNLESSGGVVLERQSSLSEPPSSRENMKFELEPVTVTTR